MPDGMTLPEHVGLSTVCGVSAPILLGLTPSDWATSRGRCVFGLISQCYCVIHDEHEWFQTLWMNRCHFNGTGGRFYSHGGDVFTGEGIGGVTDQQTGLTHSPEEDGRGRTADDKFNKKNGFVFKIHLKVCLCGFYVSGLGWVLPCTLTVPHRHWPTFMLPEGHRSPLWYPPPSTDTHNTGTHSLSHSLTHSVTRQQQTGKSELVLR